MGNPQPSIKMNRRDFYDESYTPYIDFYKGSTTSESVSGKPMAAEMESSVNTDEEIV